MNTQLNTEVTEVIGVTGIWDSSTIGAPQRDMIDEPWQDEPVVPYHVQLQNEIEALRDEVKNLKAQLLSNNIEPKFLGFPIRSHYVSDDDCRRICYDAFICGEWHEIISWACSWNTDEAIESICNILRREAKK